MNVYRENFSFTHKDILTVKYDSVEHEISEDNLMINSLIPNSINIKNLYRGYIKDVNVLTHIYISAEIKPYLGVFYKATVEFVGGRIFHISRSNGSMYDLCDEIIEVVYNQAYVILTSMRDEMSNKLKEFKKG